MLNTARCLVLCASFLATGCGSASPSAEEPLAPAAVTPAVLGVPLHSRTLPLRLLQFTGSAAALQACSQRLGSDCIHEITLCVNGKITVVFTDVLFEGKFTLGGSALHADIPRSLDGIPGSFDGVLSEDGSFTSPQLSGGLPYQNYELPAGDFIGLCG